MIEPMEPLYDGPPADLPQRLGRPGQFPFTRGVYPRMYTGGRLWTMRQYAGFSSAEESNRRYRYLLEQGVAGLSVAFDLPTQLGLDPDAPEARGEVGRVGVSIASVDDMRTLFDGIPLADVTTSMTINAPAMMLLALYTLEAERQGAPLARLGGTVQNDILKEYVARGTYIFPPEPSMRLVTDLFAWCAAHVPRWNTISISGYHIREAGSTAAQEVAFTLANAMAYVRAAVAAGLDVQSFAPRLSFFFACHNDFLEEIAKFRAARRLWAHIMRDTFAVTSERAQTLRFHTQTGGSTLTAQQPLTNVVRTAYQALAAVLGGTQSLHTNAFDEALGLPTEASARLALRTQQVLAFESGVPEAIDPLGGSYYLEHLTDALEAEARRYLDHVEALGGSVRAIELQYLQREIEDAAYEHQRAIERGDRVVVGVNRFVEEGGERVPVQAIDPALEPRRREALRAFRAARDGVAASAALARVEGVAAGTGALMPAVRDAFAARATLGEVCGVLRRVWGEHR
jgi:methylmalonyl-CoA mutase, N-terminal domain